MRAAAGKNPRKGNRPTDKGDGVTVTYSPYDLDAFQTCPRLFDLKRRWEFPETNWSINLHLGGVICVGLAVVRGGGTIVGAQSAMEAELKKRYVANDEWKFESVFKWACKGLDLGLSSDLGIKSIISADRRMYGRCRPDVVARMADGGLRVIDDKTKLKLDVKYLDETLSEYKHSNQLYEGAWEVSRYYQEPVQSIAVNLIILSPSPKVVFYPITLEPEAIEYWAKGAEDDFFDMHLVEKGDIPARPRWTSCTTRYNMPGTFTKALCQMHAICHDVHGDESKAEALGYKKVRKRY